MEWHEVTGSDRKWFPVTGVYSNWQKVTKQMDSNGDGIYETAVHHLT